jgi:hypothetical protein
MKKWEGVPPVVRGSIGLVANVFYNTDTMMMNHEDHGSEC